jgi:hypothetical protein
MVFPRIGPLDGLVDANHALGLPIAACMREPATAERSADETADDHDLERLERSLEWLKRERMIVALEVGLRAQRTPPRARALPPVSGIPPLNAGRLDQRREQSIFPLAPPRVSERLPHSAAARRPAPRLGTAVLCIVTVSVIAGAIAYHASIGRLFSTLAPAQASSFASNDPQINLRSGMSKPQ